MSIEAMAQINVRLPRKLKDSGDAGLRRMGLSPSDAIRALWSRLSNPGTEFDAIRAMLLGNESNTPPKSTFDQSPIAQGWRQVDVYIERLGISMNTIPDEGHRASDEELLAQALEERMQERGVM